MSQIIARPSRQAKAGAASRSYLNAGFIGVGNFVRGNHLPNIEASELWNVHTICDINEEHLRQASATCAGATTTRRYEDILADPEIDAVVLGVRHGEHVRFIQEIAAAGKHVLVEKPMSMSNAESEAIVDAVQTAGVKLMVGFNRRFGPLYSRARRLFQSQHRGKRAMITFRAVEDGRMWPSWPLDPNVGGGLILCECCHFFDFLSWFLDDEPERIFCEGARETDNVVTVRFRNGSVGCIVSGGCGSVCYPKERLEVFCDGTTLAVDQCLELHVDGYPGEADRTWPFKKDPFPEAGGHATSVLAYRQKMKQWAAAGISEEERRAKAYYGSMPNVHKGHFEEIEAFARAILEGRPSPCDEIDGARATACCVAAVRSMESGYLPMNVSPEEYFLNRRRTSMRAGGRPSL